MSTFSGLTTVHHSVFNVKVITNFGVNLRLKLYRQQSILFLILTISAATKIGFYTNFAEIVKTDGLFRVHFGGEIFILYAFQSIEWEQQVYTI